MTSSCSTHVLDAARGRPAAGVAVLLSAGGAPVEEAATDADGRVRFAADLTAGPHRLTFATGPWFAEQQRDTFFPEVTLDFLVSDGEHHHVALLLSPFAYTTYRGVVMTDGIVLGANQYGKAECRLVHVTRDGGQHSLADLNVTTQLRGDFAAAHTEGDNSHVHATDTQKNSVYALAREHGVASPEGFLLTLAEHWRHQPWVTGTFFSAEHYGWERVPVAGRDHDHSFARAGREVRTAVVQTYGDATHILSGLTDLVVLKSTGSEFRGFPRDRFTTLAETDDRILATSVTAWWRHTDLGTDWNASYEEVRATLLEAFADTHSLALQQTIFAMGSAVLRRCPAIAEVRLSCPNKHHFLVDLTPFGLDNPNQVYFAADRPYGLIQATVRREDVPEEPQAWTSVPGALE